MPVYIHDGIECVSAGILFYRRTGKDVELLFLEKRDKKKQTLLEDPGGKSQADDESIEMTAAREAAEELNAKIQDPSVDVDNLSYQLRVDASRDYILRIIKSQPWCLLQPKTKYAIFICAMPDECSNLDFGTREMHPRFEIERRARWLTIPEVQLCDVKTLHPRIRNLLWYL